jgi:hypothetical protein
MMNWYTGIFERKWPSFTTKDLCILYTDLPPLWLYQNKNKKSLLWKFIFSPDNCSKVQSINFVFTASSRSCTMNKIVSSAYYSNETPPSVRWGISPHTWPSSFARAIKMANMSVTKLKRSGDRGFE